MKRQCLSLFYKVKEENGKDMDNFVINITKEEMNNEIFPNWLYRSHRFRKPKPMKKERSIIATFVHYYLRNKIFKSRFLKGKNISVTESCVKSQITKAKLQKILILGIFEPVMVIYYSKTGKPCDKPLVYNGHFLCQISIAK